jgi:hypothetical protein
MNALLFLAFAMTFDGQACLIWKMVYVVAYNASLDIIGMFFLA